LWENILDIFIDHWNNHSLTVEQISKKLNLSNDQTVKIIKKLKGQKNIKNRPAGGHPDVRIIKDHNNGFSIGQLVRKYNKPWSEIHKIQIILILLKYKCYDM
jgi:Mor family transcriptional regulator